MLPIALGLLTALSYGAADFIGGLMSRRLHYARVGVITQGAAFVVVAVGLLFVSGQISASALLWGALSGVGSGVGSVALYRGLGRGQMNVVAPISAVGSAAIPVIAGLALGDRPSWVTLIGVVLVIPAVWLISKSSGPVGGGLADGAVDGIVAGVGFGVLFLSLAQAPSNSGLWPTAASQLASFVLLSIFAAFLVWRKVPRERSTEARARLGAAFAGLLGSVATVAFLFASRAGLLVVVSVLAALYPGITVLLARFVLHEHTSRTQLLGLGLAVAGVVVITLG